MSSRSKSQRRPGGPRRQPAPQKKSALSWPIIASGIGAVVVVVGALIVFGLMTSGGESGNELSDKIDASLRTLPEQDGQALGSANAPLTLEVYEDFQCPFCVRFMANIEPALVDEYVKTGKVRLIYQNFPVLGFESTAAGAAQVCAAEQDRGWNFALRLFSMQAAENQVESEKLNVGRLDADALRGFARDAGLDTGRYDSCIAQSSTAEAVGAQYAKGTAAGVRGTPSFVLNGTLIANTPDSIEGWRSLLDQRLAAVTPTAKP